MAKYCSKLFLDGTYSKRLFCIFDKHNPYNVSLRYKLLVPETYTDTEYGLIFSQTYQKIRFTGAFQCRLSTKKECIDLINNLNNGKYCISCSNINHCKSPFWLHRK